jgi:asparagine synthase (glutamine-hydrolysing)
MCGIVGTFHRDRSPVSPARLERANRLIDYRGPDDSGYLFLDSATGRAVPASDSDTIPELASGLVSVAAAPADCDVAFGHRRLAIIDLSAGGHQPMSSPDGRDWITFNGEIYNYREIKRDLESSGHTFRTSSDTEVLLAAYRKWGTAFLARLNGIFAFALWDGERRGLLIARDHLGVKPLYYRLTEEEIDFCSEIKGILALSEKGPEVDLDVLNTLLTFRYVPSPETLFRGICKLEPGTALWIEKDRTQAIEYWNGEPEHSNGSRPSATPSQYLTKLEETIARQLVSDVPVGILLSSGIDSSAILKLMTRHGSGSIQAFTADFQDSELNEGDRARAYCRELGVEHHRVVVTPADYQNFFDRYMWHLEEPVGNESALANYFVSELAARHVKVVLTGQGADEPWAGYARYRGVALSGLYQRVPPWLRRGVVEPAVRMLPRSERLKRGAAALGRSDDLERFVAVYTIFDAAAKARLYNEAMRQHTNDGHANARLSKLFARGRGLDPVGRMLYVDTRMWLPDDLLLVGDKLAMAHSLEARVPYLDPWLIEFIESIPTSQKLRFGKGKILHKQALASLLPQRILARKKLGFANPVDSWLRTRSEIVRATLLDPDSPAKEFFRREAIENLLAEHAAGRENHMRKIFLLFSIVTWRRTFSRAPGGALVAG